jgi:ER membrane protein complex subunit 7
MLYHTPFENLMKTRSGFRIDSLLKNPMILLAIFSLGIVFIIPRLTASLGPSVFYLQWLILDPDALADYRAQQAQTAATAPQLPSFDFASFMAGSSKKPVVDKTRKTK